MEYNTFEELYNDRYLLEISLDGKLYLHKNGNITKLKSKCFHGILLTFLHNNQLDTNNQDIKEIINYLKIKCNEDTLKEINELLQ